MTYSSRSAARSVNYASGTLTVDGQPELLLVAILHYFQTPRRHWPDALARTKRAGINALRTGIAWNRHQPEPDRFQWNDDLDLEAFARECETQGLYLLVQPEPTEETLPDWLSAVASATELQSARKKWLDRLVPLLTGLEWAQGGPVVLAMAAPESSGFRERGLNVPILPPDALPVLAGDTPSEIEYAAWRCWAEGERGYIWPASLLETETSGESWRACRRVALWAHTFREILLQGEHKQDLAATPGLRVTETATRERGSILFIANPDPQNSITGSVFPYLPEVTLAPHHVLPWVHDTPIGPSDRYLAAYAGLVKSDAPVLTAHIRPDPHAGVRVYVYGEPGETREIVLFNGDDRGQAVEITFTVEPQVHPVGPSQVVALSARLAGGVFFPPDGVDAPVLLGADDVLEHTADTATLRPSSSFVYALYGEGAVREIPLTPDSAFPGYDDSGWAEVDIPLIGPIPGNWFRALVHLEDETDATLHFASAPGGLTLWHNGEPVGSAPGPDPAFSLRLPAGESVFCVYSEGGRGIGGQVTLTPTGGCYLLDVAHWRVGHPLCQVHLSL